MDKTNRYGDIITAVMREEVEVSFCGNQHRLQVVTACDRESGEFLMII